MSPNAVETVETIRETVIQILDTSLLPSERRAVETRVSVENGKRPEIEIFGLNLRRDRRVQISGKIRGFYPACIVRFRA